MVAQRALELVGTLGFLALDWALLGAVFRLDDDDVDGAAGEGDPCNYQNQVQFHSPRGKTDG